MVCRHIWREVRFRIPDWAVIEHAIEYRTSIFAYNPNDAGYPWDADKTKALREKYGEIAEHVEEIE